MKPWSSLTSSVVALSLVSFSVSVSATYQNFTVGESDGWTPSPSVSYSDWASHKNFTLGDFLIFNFAKPAYDVIRTYSKTVYKNCDYKRSNRDYEVWGEPGVTKVAEIPLVKIGHNYFFCSVNNSKLCKAGMKFRINVSVGDGLPASLATPPPSLTNGSSSPSQTSSPNSDGTSNNGNHDGSGAPCIHPRSLPLLVALLVPVILFPLALC